MNYILNTSIGNFTGLDNGTYAEFRGIRYAQAKRFEYPEMIKEYGEYDATQFGACCFQRRAFENDEECNAFYHKEFRAGMSFTYSEDCLFLNIYAPKDKKDCPVLLYIHGGSFTGGSADEGHIDGKAYAEKGIVFVAINYRLGPYGFMAHTNFKKDGVCGNYGLADQQCAIDWVIKNIENFGGCKDSITLLGQSAGAMSVDIQLSNPNLSGKIKAAVLMSGAGIQRLVAKPFAPEKLNKFWEQIAENAGVTKVEFLKNVDEKTLFYAWDKACKASPLSMLYTMPVCDGRIVSKMKFNGKNMPTIPLLLGITITDMMPIALCNVIKKYTDKSNAYLYSFDRLLPGDNSGAWHSCDLLYAFATLDKNWRPFDDNDRKISDIMVNAISNFVFSGDPNCAGLPQWNKGEKNAVHLAERITTGPLDQKQFLTNTFANNGAKF